MSCTFDGRPYSEGSLICSNGKELRCSGSQWSETGYTCFSESLDKYTRIDPSGTILSDSDFVSKNSQDSAKIFTGCLKFLVPPQSKMGRIFNSCNRCMTAHLAWDNGQMTSENIPPGNYKDFLMRSSFVQIVDESPC